MGTSRSVLVVSATKVIGKVLGLAWFVVFARALPGREFGEFVLFVAVINVLSMFVDLGFGGAVEKRISGGLDADRVLGTAAVLRLSLLVVVSAAVLPLGHRIDALVGGPYAVYLVPVLAVHQFGRLSLSTLQGELRVGLAFLLRATRQLSFLVVGLALLTLEFGVPGLVVGYAASWTLLVVVGLGLAETGVGRPSREVATSLYGFAKHNFVPSILAQRTNNWMDVLVVGLLLGQLQAAAYETAWRLSMSVMVVSGSIASAVFPRISDWAESGDREAIQDLLPGALSGSVVFVLPAVTGAVLLDDELIRYVFGAQYTIASVALVVLVASKAFESVNAVLGRVLLGTDRPGPVSRAAVVFICSNVALNVVLTAQFGLAGAAVATGLAMALNVVLLWRHVDEFLEPRFLPSVLRGSLLGTAGVAVAVWAYSSVVGVDDLLGVGIAVALGAVVYVSVLAIDGGTRGYVRRFLEDATSASV